MAVRYSKRSSSDKIRETADAVGDRIARLRAKGRISLRTLAEKSGVSSSMICDIENGTKSPTIAVLSAIAESLGVRLSDLVAEADAATSPVAIRRKEGSQIFYGEQGIERRQLSPNIPGSNCEIVQLEIPAQKGTGMVAPHAPGTTEYVYLVKGSLEVRVGNQSYALKAGDCIGFDADARHAYSNTGSSRAIVYVVIEHAS